MNGQDQSSLADVTSLPSRPLNHAESKAIQDVDQFEGAPMAWLKDMRTVAVNFDFNDVSVFAVYNPEDGAWTQVARYEYDDENPIIEVDQIYDDETEELLVGIREENDEETFVEMEEVIQHVRDITRHYYDKTVYSVDNIEEMPMFQGDDAPEPPL